MGRFGLDNGPVEVWYCGGHLWSNDVLAAADFGDDVQDGSNAAPEALAAVLPRARHA